MTHLEASGEREASAAPLRTLIVDDEPLAIERMQVLCAEIAFAACATKASACGRPSSPMARRCGSAGPSCARSRRWPAGDAKRGAPEGTPRLVAYPDYRVATATPALAS